MKYRRRNFYINAFEFIGPLLSQIPACSRNKKKRNRPFENFPQLHSITKPSISGWRYFHKRCSILISYGLKKIFLWYRMEEIFLKIFLFKGDSLKSETVGYCALSTASNPKILSIMDGVSQ